MVYNIMISLWYYLEIMILLWCRKNKNQTTFIGHEG